MARTHALTQLNEWSLGIIIRCLIIVGIGIGMTQQMATNSLLSDHLGSAFFASFISFAGGMILIFLCVVVQHIFVNRARAVRAQATVPSGNNANATTTGEGEEAIVKMDLNSSEGPCTEDPNGVREGVHEAGECSAVTAAPLSSICLGGQEEGRAPTIQAVSVPSPNEMRSQQGRSWQWPPIWMLAGGVIGSTYVAGTVYATVNIQRVK